MRFAGLFILASVLCCAAVPAETVSLDSLLGEMTNLERLTTLPNPAYVTRQFSSYDRRSTDPAVQDDSNWFANGDRGQVLRAEEGASGREHVLMEADGPGAVVRFWSANANEGGVVRVYLDGAAEPVLDMPLSAMLGGMVHPFLPPLSGVHSKGWNSYLPIPYAKHCKITVSKHDIYYQINYRTYAPGTEVKTFTMDDVAGLADKLGAVMSGLSEPSTLPLPEDTRIVPFRVEALNPGDSDANVIPPAAPQAIYGMQMRVKTEDLEAALRGCLMELSFDGNAPAVVAPLGDFFGTAPGANAYQSLPSGVLRDGTLYSRWVMPFRETATVTFYNYSGVQLTLEGEAHFRDRPWTDDSLYFHAKWRTVRDLPTRPMVDWNYLTAGGGPGRFAGVMLHITNPVPQWWGEGDEKIYVDGEAFPSHFGTGTEDYFGYAWCSPETFTHAYHNQPRCDGPGNFGQTCVSRFHIMDDIPWTDSFKFDMEMWHWKDPATVSQSVTAYWYAKAGGTDNTPAADRDLLTVPAVAELPGVEGAIEGEAMEVVSVSGGEAAPQEGVWDWSRTAQMWWKGAKPGDKLALGFQVEKAGKYTVTARMTKAKDYGIHQISINGQPAGDPIDFWNREVTGTDPVSLGVFDLKEGQNLFEVEVRGANEKAIKAHMFGLDYLLLKEE